MTAESTQSTRPTEPREATGPSAPPRADVRRLYRSRTNRVLSGVCGGIAEYYGSDPTAVRLAALVIGLFTGIFPMVIVYIIAALVVPEGDGAAAGERHEVAPGQAAVVLGALLVLIGIAGFANVWLRVDWEHVWPVAVIGLGAVLVLSTLRTRH
jgi:phage shock protein C